MPQRSAGALGGTATAMPIGSGYAFTPTAQNQCTDTMVVAIPGGANTVEGVPQSVPHGFLVGDIANQLNDHGIAQRTVSYRAEPFFLMSYKQSMNEGYHRARNVIAQTARQCPGAKIAIVGFSEGSDIGSHIVADISAGRGPIPADRFAAATLIANPHNGHGSKKKAGTLRDGEGILGAMPSYGELGDQVQDICNVDDFICNRYAATPGTRAITKRLLDASVFNPIGGVDPMQFIAESPRIALGTHNHVTSYKNTYPVPEAVGHILANRDGKKPAAKAEKGAETKADQEPAGTEKPNAA